MSDRIPRYDAPPIKALMEIVGITKEIAADIFLVLGDYTGYENHEDKFQCCNKLLFTYGIEAIRIEDDETFTDEGIHLCPRYSYLNMGETHATTLIRDHKEGKWIVSSWGDVMEESEMEYTEPLEDFELEQMLNGYIDCALWSSTDESNDQGGDPLDDNYTEEDIDSETLEEMKKDCINFAEENIEDLRRSGLDWNQIGHDFWLTRNGHGAGFWDRNLPDGLGDKLSAACKPYGTYDLYVYGGKVFGR